MRGARSASRSRSFFDTDGFHQVIAEERGAVDTKAQVDYKNVGLKADYSPADRVSTFFRVGYFREERDNAKVTTVAPITPEMNDTEWKTLSAGLRASLPDQSDLQASFFVDNNRFNSNFLAVPAVVRHHARRPAALARPPDDRAARPDGRRWRAGAVVEADLHTASDFGGNRFPSHQRRERRRDGFFKRDDRADAS